MRFVSYAQEMEDLYIYLLLKDFVSIGNYIDVGANDPVELSVTKAFYDLGWSGINIEPLPDMCALLESERPRDINLCIGIGEREGTLNLFKAGTGSTFSNDVKRKYIISGGDRNELQREVLPLQTVYDRYCPLGTEIHFCKIDVEGYEKQVLLGIDYGRMRPWVMVVEAAEPGTAIPCYEAWEDILLSNGYLFAFASGINRYYVASEKNFLLDNLREQINMGKKITVVKNQCSPYDFSLVKNNLNMH